tara:strand:+ start:717 stop:1583 length:867 start_codon:yes stop_codon:yes gene_type:complete
MTINRIKKINYSYTLKSDEKSLVKEKEYELIFNWQKHKDKKSLEKLLKAFNKLIRSISKKYISYGLSQEDLMQEGSTGLIHAIEKFEPEKGFRLSTYAQWWIKAKIQNYILKNWSIVKSGSTASQKTLFFGLNKLKKQINFNTHGFMGQNELEKISKILDINSNQIQNMENKLAMGDQSLNQKIDDENGSDLLSQLKDNSLTPDIIFQKNYDYTLKKKWLNESINQLNEREREIIISRNSEDGKKTLDCIGKQLNISKERVRQIETVALKKLKKNILQISSQPKEFFV